MPIVTLESNLSNLRQYVDSLFDKDVRTAPTDLNTWDPNGAPAARWFNDDGHAMEKIVTVLANLFHDGFDESCRWNVPSDVRLMNFFSQRLKPLTMYVPALKLTETYKHKEGKPMWKTEYTSPVYRVTGYKKMALSTAEGALQFIGLFLAGAHFVVLHNTTDLGGSPVPNFYTSFENDQTLKFDVITLQRPDIDDVMTLGISSKPGTDKVTATGHTHYTGLGSSLGTAYCYPKITTEAAPPRCPIVCSLLVDTTDRKKNNDYNTFFQLEGWPGTSWGGLAGRHAADFETHSITKWNIATYGLCAYSEKRGTTVFLTHANWNPTVRTNWHMPNYAGARKQRPDWIAAHPNGPLSGNVGGILP